METLVLELAPETLRRIEAVATEQGRTPAEVVRERVEAAFTRLGPDAPIEALGTYLVEKNAKLYRRLA